MEELDVVRRDEHDCFGLGPKMIELAGALLSHHDLRTEGEPLLQHLCDETQETTHLAIPTGNSVVYIAKVDSPHSIRMASPIGIRNPMHCTAWVSRLPTTPTIGGSHIREGFGADRFDIDFIRDSWLN
jgi:DNA-binding IclR family transcriptional regulator